MAEKKDFLSSLASQVEAKKRGETDRIPTVDDFVSSRKTEAAPADDLNEYPSFDEVISASGKKAEEKPRPKIEEKPLPEEKKEADFVPAFTDENAYSSGGKADSFNEEQFVRYEKPKRTVSKGAIGALAALAALILFAVWWFLIAAHIVMPDFVGKNISEVSTWARQNEISSNAIATAAPEYSLEYANNVVIRQSVDPGKKIKKDTPITFTVSAGPDPEELISFPDIRSMTLAEIREWIAENKLLKAKITTQYSTNIPNGEVISYEVKNGSESEFTRGTTLNIIGSKGQAPAGQITVLDFKNKTYAEVENWASGKKINLIRQDVFSDTVANSVVISQSAEAGTSLKEGDTFSVIVSKGKGIRIPNLVGYTREQLEAWRGKNPIQVVTKSLYNPAPDGSVIEQSISPNTTVASDEVLELTISLYLPTLDHTTGEWLGQDYLKLKAWVDEVNSKGGNIQAGQYGNYQYNLCSDEYPNEGQIIAYACEYGTSGEGNGCTRPLSLDARIAYTISTGACSVRQFILELADMSSLEAITNWCIANHITYSVEPDPDPKLKDGEIYIETTKTSIIRQTGAFPVLIPEGTVMNIHWGASKAAPSPTPTPTPAPGQLILEATDMASLSAIKSFCDMNGLSYLIHPEGEGFDETDTGPKIKITIGDVTLDASSSYPYVFTDDQFVDIYYLN